MADQTDCPVLSTVLGTRSPILFIAVGEAIMRSVEECLNEEKGITIGGRQIWNIRYADYR